jgi:hypothetical protein
MTMLLGKTIVITGVASGIGARTAEFAGQFGADVIGVDMREPATPGGIFVKADISTQAGVDRLAAQLPARIDALCNIAGLSGKTGLVPVLSVNFYGLRALSEALAPKIREGGAIVNVASIAGFGWRANLNRAVSMVGAEGFPDVTKVVSDHDVKNEEGYPRSTSLPISSAGLPPLGPPEMVSSNDVPILRSEPLVPKILAMRASSAAGASPNLSGIGRFRRSMPRATQLG